MSVFYRIIASLFISVLFSFSVEAVDNKLSGNYQNNRYPLLQKEYIELPLGNIKAKGWIYDQLLIMKKGMTGNLDKIYEAVMGKRNGWLGGDGDVWERGPYWIDGLLPLAYILDDEELKQKVKPWIEWTLASQKENGYFGPDTDRPFEEGLQRDNSHDWWPKMVMLKILQQYYSATGDERVLKCLTNYFKYQLKTLPESPLGHWTFWGEQRGGDNLMIVYWLYNITGEDFLLELGEIIHKQTFDWTNVFLNRDYLSRQHSLHCVNLAQGFKEPVIYYQQSKDYQHIESVKSAVNQIRNTIGLPTGLWGGDELLRFGKPTAGSELCTAVEMMFSLEEMLEITGDVQWADYLERIAYNALPTQVADDYSARQYYQQLNQVSVTRNWREFSTPHEDTDLLFGTLTGYPCCTSNLHQGWPKLVQNLWYATADNGIAALVYAPSEVSVKVADNVEVRVKEDTFYPFDENINFEISFIGTDNKQAFFPFHFRTPEWCLKPIVKLNGKVLSIDTYSGEISRINRNWKEGDKLTIEFPMNISVSRWYDGSAVVERGPLIYALKMNERWEKKSFESDKKTRFGEFYYEVTSDSPWNFALPENSLRNISSNFEIFKKEHKSTYPWNVSNAPIIIRTKAKKLKNWRLINGSVGPIAYYTQIQNDTEGEEYIELIPYGCTTLRIAEFPVR
ncbi:MAG: glycoside hydrolase family 127 protein [Parabacteroides sp.]|nr:glycoside hydrolase family 127 protein [Parabacteroides sp.]